MGIENSSCIADRQTPTLKSTEALHAAVADANADDADAARFLSSYSCWYRAPAEIRGWRAVPVAAAVSQPRLKCTF